MCTWMFLGAKVRCLHQGEDYDYIDGPMLHMFRGNPFFFIVAVMKSCVLSENTEKILLYYRIQLKLLTYSGTFSFLSFSRLNGTANWELRASKRKLR